MQSYNFQCNECGNEFSLKKSANETLLASCPVCESPNAQRILSEAEIKKQNSCNSGGCSSCGGGCNCK